MSKQFHLFKKAVRGEVEENIFFTLWDFLESWTSQNDWMAIFFIIFLGIIFEIILIKICTSFQKKPALPEKGSSDSQENDDSSLKSLTFDNWSIHSSSEERVDDFSERTIASSLTSEESEGNVEKRALPADEIICAGSSESKHQVCYFSESRTASSNGTSSSLSLFHSEIKKIILSHRGYPENENKIQFSSKNLFSIMKTNKNKSLMFSSDFNFPRTSGITMESEDLDVAPCPPAHLFLSGDQVKLLEENVKNQIPLKPNATLQSKILCSRSQGSLIQNQHSVRMDISAQIQDSFPGQSALQNQGFYETQFTSQAQQFVNHQDLINSQTNIEARHFAPPQDLRRKPFSSSTQDPFQTQDMDRSQHLVKVPCSVETRGSVKGLKCDKNPRDEIQYSVWSEDSNKINYSLQGKNTIFKNARFLVLTLSPNSVAEGMPQLKSTKPEGQKQIATSKLNQYSVYGSVSLSPAIKRQKNKRKALHNKSKFSLKGPSPKSKKTPTSWVFQITVCHNSKRRKLGCKYNSKKKELHPIEELECNTRSNIKNMEDKRISDAFHNATNTTISEPSDTEMHGELKAKTDTPRIIGLSHSVVKQKKLPDEKKIWNAKYIEKKCIFKKPQEHNREEEEQTLQEAVSQLSEDFRFSLQLKQKPKYIKFQIGQSSSGSRKTQNKEQELQPQTLSTQTILGTSPCPTMNPFQVEKAKQSRGRLTVRETEDLKNPLTVPENLPASEVFTETPEHGTSLGESPRKTLHDHIAEEKEDLKRLSPAVALRSFIIHILPLSYFKRQKIRKKISGTKSVLNPKCVNMKVKKPAILLMPYINRRGTPSHRKRLRGNLKILIKQMLPDKIMADVLLNVTCPHMSSLPHIRTHSRLNAENHNHTKLKQEKSQIEWEEKCSDSINKELIEDSGNTVEEAKLQEELRGDKETPPEAVLHDSWNLRLDAHPEMELNTEEEMHQPITSAETIMESLSSSIMDPSHVENMKKSLTTQTDLKCTEDSEIPPPTSEKSLIGDPLNQTRESDVSDTREMGYCFAETRAELSKDLPATFPQTFNCHMPGLTHSKVKEKRVRFTHIDCIERPKSLHIKTIKPSVSQLFNVTGHREKLESNFKTKFEKINQANGLVYEFLNALYSPMHSRLQVETNGFCHAHLKQGELTDEGRPRYVDKSSAFNNREAKVQDGEEVEQKPLLEAAPQRTRYLSGDGCQGKETHLDKPDPALNCLTQELQDQTCFTKTALQTDLQMGPREAEELQKTNKTENAITAPRGLKIPPPKAENSSFDKHLNMTTECGLPSGGNPKEQLDSYFVGKNSELPKDLQVTFLMSSDSVESFVSKSKRKKNTSRTSRKQIRVSRRTHCSRGEKPSTSHMLNDSQSKGLQCNLKKMKNPQQNKNVADAFLDIFHSKVPIFPYVKMSNRLSIETDMQKITRLGRMQLVQEKLPNARKVRCPDPIDVSSLSNSVKNGKEEEREREALPAPENSRDFMFHAYQENCDLVKSDEEMKQPESIYIQVQPQIRLIQTILDSAPCPILDHFQFGNVGNCASFSRPKSRKAKTDEIICSATECGVPSEANHPKEQAGDIEKKETVTFDCCMPACATSKRKRNFKQYLGMKTFVNPKCKILKAKKPSISYILNIKGGTSPSHRKELGFNLKTKMKEVHQDKKVADKMCSFMSIIHDSNMYNDIRREKDMVGEKRLSSKQVRQAISHEGSITSDNIKETNHQGEEEEENEQETLLKVVLPQSQHFIFYSDQRKELDLHKSENERSRKILFVTEQDIPQQMQPTDPVQVEEPTRSHQTQNGTIYTASSKLPIIKSKESLIGEVLIDTMKCSHPSDGSHMEELYSRGKEEKAEFKKDQRATILESLDVTTPDPSESKRQRKTFTCTALKSKMSPKCIIVKARKTPISKIFNIPGNACLKSLPSKTLKSQIIDFLIHIIYSVVLEDLTVERKAGLAQELPAMLLESLDLSTIALPASKRNNLKLIHKKNKMNLKHVTLKAKKAPISQTFNITKRATPIHGSQFECNFKTMMKQDQPVAHIILNAISSAMPVSLDRKVHSIVKGETDMPRKMRFSHELKARQQSPYGERAWCTDSSDKRDSISNSTKEVEVRGREALWNSQHFTFSAHKMKEPHFVKSDLELKSSARNKIRESHTTAQELQQQTLFTQSVLHSISCSILNLLPLEKLPKRTNPQKGLNATGSPKILSLMPRKSISESFIVTAKRGIPFEKSPRKEVGSSIPEGEIRLQKDFQARTLESFDFSMPVSSEFKGQGSAAQIHEPRPGQAKMASVLRTVNITRSSALSCGKEQDRILENTTEEIPLGMSNIFINTFLSSTSVSTAIKTHKKLKAKKGPLRKNNITQLKQDEGKRLNTYSSNKWSTSNNTSESRWQNEKEEECNEMLFKARLQFLNSIGSRKDQKMLIAEQEVQQKTLVSKNILELICSPLIPFQTKNVKKTISPQKDILHRIGEKIPCPKSRKATFDDLLINETTFDESPTRKLDVNSAVSLQPEEEKEYIKTIKYTVDQNIPPTKSGNSVLGDPCNKSCRRKMGGHIAKKHEALQRDLLTMSTKSVLSESKRQKKVLKFPERKNLTYFWSLKTPFPKAGKSETDLIQCDTLWDGNPRKKWDSPVSEKKAWNKNDLAITFLKPLDFSSLDSSEPESQSYTSEFVAKKHIMSPKHVTLKVRKPPNLHLLNITGYLTESHKKKKQDKFKYKMKERQLNESVGEPLFHATEGAKIPPPKLVSDKSSLDTTVRGALYNRTLHNNLDRHITEEMAGLGENLATTFWGPLDFTFPVLSDSESQINTVQLSKKKITPNPKCLTLKKKERPISQILKINRQFTTKHREKLRSNLQIKMKEMPQGKNVADTFPNAIYFTFNISDIKRQSRLETEIDRVSKFSPIQPIQMDLSIKGPEISPSLNAAGHSALSINKEQEQKIDIEKDKIELNADLKFRHASMPIQLHIKMEHSPNTCDIYEECSEKRNALNKATVREKQEYEKQVLFRTIPQYIQPFEFGADQMREPGPFKSEAPLINTVCPKDITSQKTDIDLIDQKAKIKAVEEFSPESVSFSKIHLLQIKTQKTKCKTANWQTMANPKILIPKAEKSLADVHSVNTIECDASLQQSEGMEVGGRGQPVLYNKQQEPRASGTIWSPASADTLMYPKIRKLKARAKAADVKNSVHTKQAKLKAKKPLDSQLPNTTGYGTQSNKKEMRCDINTQKKAFQQGKTVADLVLSTICDSGSIPSQIKGFVVVKGETSKPRKLIRIPPPLKLNKSLRRKMSSSQSTDKSVISRNIKTLKQCIREQKEKHQTVLLDLLSQCRDQSVISQQVEKEADRVKLADLEREVCLDPSSQKREINYTRFDIPKIRTHTEMEFLTAPRVKDRDEDIVECSVSFPWGREASEKTDNSLSSKGQNMFLTELDASQQKIRKEQEPLKQGSTSMRNLQSTACSIMESPHLENTGKVTEKDINRKNISHLLGREGLKETDVLQGQKFLCINLEVHQNMSTVKPDHGPESILDSVSGPNREPLHVKQAVNATRKENVSIPISLDVNPWKKEQLKLTDIPLKSSRQKMNFSKKTRAKELNSSNQNKENILVSISSCILHHLHIKQLKKEVSAEGISSTVLSPMVEKSSKEAGIPVDQPPCSEGINLHIRGRKEQEQESICKVLPTSISHSSLDILQIKSPRVKKALKVIDSPTYHTSNTEGKKEQPECMHQTFTKLASHSLKEIFQSKVPCKKKTLDEVVSTVDYTPSAEGTGSLITRKGEQQEICTCEALPKPASHSKSSLLQISTPVQQVKLDDTNMMHCEYLTSQAKEALKGMDDIVGYTQKSEKRQNLLSIEQKQQHLLIPCENFLGHMSYPQNDPWLLQHLMPQTKEALAEVGNVSSRTKGLDLFSKDQPNTVCAYGLECIVPSILPKQMKKQNTTLPLESCSKTIKYLNVSFPKGKKSSDRAQVVDLISNCSSSKLRIRKMEQSCKAYHKKVQKEVCLPGRFLYSPSIFMPLLPDSKIQKNSIKQRVKKDIICSKRRTLKLKKSVFPNILDITDCDTPGNRPELQCNIKEKMVNKTQRKGKPDLVVTNIYEFIPSLPHLKLNKLTVDGIIANNLKRTKQHMSQKKEKDRTKGVNMKGIMDLNVILKGKKSSLSHILNRKELPVQIKQESKVQIGKGKSDVKLTTLCTSLPSLSYPNLNSRIKVGKDKSGIPRSCLPQLELQASSNVRKMSFAESINRDSLSNVIEPKQYLPQKKREDRENIACVKDIMGVKCITFKGKKTTFKHMLHGKEPQWNNKEQEKMMQEDKSDLDVVQNKPYASIPSSPYLEWSPGIKEIYMRRITRFCFPSTLQELTDAVGTCEEPTDETLSSIKKAKYMPQKEEDRVEMALEEIRHPQRIALKVKQSPIAQELQLNIKEKEKKMQEDKDKQVGIQSKFCASVSFPPYSAVDTRIKGEAAMLIKTRSSFLQPKFQGSWDIGKIAYKKSIYGDISNSVKKAKEHIMQEKDERIKLAKIIPLKKRKSPISQEIQWDIKEQEKKIQKFQCKSSVVLTNTSISMPDASHLKLDTKIKKADYFTEVTRYSLPELSHQKSSDAGKREHTKSLGIISTDVKIGPDYEPQKGENGGKTVNMKNRLYCKGTTSKAKTLPLPHVLSTPKGCGPQIREVETNVKEKLGHIQERKSELDEVLTRLSLPQFKLNKGREGKEEKREITKPVLSCSRQKESSDADKLKYTVSPLNDVSSDSKRTQYMMQKEEDKAYAFEKDIMHPMCIALNSKKSPLFHILKTEELQVKIEGQVKGGQESNKETIVLLSEICPVTSLTQLKLDAIKEEEGEPVIIRNDVPCLELQQSLSSGQIASTKCVDSYVEKGKQQLPQEEKDRVQNRTKVDKDLLEITGLSPLQLQLPVSSGAGKIKYADSNEGISSCRVIIKVNQHMPCKEAKDRVQVEDGKGRIFPQITSRAEISPLTHLLGRKRLHLNLKEQGKDVPKGQGKPEVVLRKTSASLPFPSHLKQDTRMNGKEDTVGVTQSYFLALKSRDPSNSGKTTYTKSLDGHMLKEEDRLKIDIEDNIHPIHMDLKAKTLPLPHILNNTELQWKIKEQKRKVQEDKNKLVTNVKSICTSLTLPYLKFDATEEEGYMIRIPKLTLPQLQSKELSDAAKRAYAETTDGEISNNIKELKECVLQGEEKDREKKVDVNGIVDPSDMHSNVKKSSILLTYNLGDLQWKTKGQEGKVREVPCEPAGVVMTKTCTYTSSPLHLNVNTRIKEKSMATLTSSSVSPIHVQGLADSEEVVYVGPSMRDILINPQEEKQCMPQSKEEDGVETINLMFPKHQEKIQESKDDPGVLLTQSSTSLPSLSHIKSDKEILVDGEMLVLKRSVLQRISNAGESVHTEPISGDTMKDVQNKKQYMPQKEERDREEPVVVRGLTHTTARTLKSKKSSPSYTLHRTELHLKIGRQEQEKREGQGKPPSTMLRKVYVSKPPPTNIKLDKGTQVDEEGLGMKRPCLFPLRLSALSDAEKIENTEAIGGDVRKRKQYISQKEKMYEVDMRIRMQHKEARISPISHIFNTKEFMLNIKKLKEKVHKGNDEPCMVLTRTFLSIPSALPLYLDSGSKTDKDAPRVTGSACPQKNLQESLDTQKIAIRESVSGSKIIVETAGHTVPREKEGQWTSNFMISVQRRNETPQVKSEGDLSQLIVNSQHEDIYFTGFDTLGSGKKPECFFTGLEAQPEKYKTETFTTFLSCPTMDPTKIENLKIETEIMDNLNHKMCPPTLGSLPKEISKEIYVTLGTPVNSKGFSVSEEDDHQTLSKASPGSADSCKFDKPEKDVQCNDKMSKMFSSKALAPQIKGSLKKINIRKSNTCQNIEEQEIAMKKQAVQRAESGHITRLNSSLSLKFPLQNGKQKTPSEIGVHEQTTVYPGIQILPGIHTSLTEFDTIQGKKEQAVFIPEQEECILESLQKSPFLRWPFPPQSGELKEKNKTHTSTTVNAKQKKLEMEDGKLKIDTNIAVHLKEDKIEMHKHTTVNLEKEKIKMDTSNTVNLNVLSLKAKKSQVKTRVITEMANSCPIKQKHKKELEVSNAKQNIQPQKLFQRHILDSLYAYIPLSHKFEGRKGRLTIADLKRELCPTFLTMKSPKHPILQILGDTGHGTPSNRKKLEYDYNKPKKISLWSEGASGTFIRSLSISMMSPSQTEETIESEMNLKREKRICVSKFQEKSPNANKSTKRNNSSTVKKGDQNFTNRVPEDPYPFVVDQQQKQKLPRVKSEANPSSEITEKSLTPETEERVVPGHDISRIIKEPDWLMMEQEEKEPEPILTPTECPCISEDPKGNVDTHRKSTLSMSISPPGGETQLEIHLFDAMEYASLPKHRDQSEPMQNTTTQNVQQQKTFSGTVPIPPQVKNNEIKIVADSTNAESLLLLYEAIKNVFESQIKSMTQNKVYADILEKVKVHKSDDWKSPPFAWGPDTTYTTIHQKLQPKPILKCFSPKLKNKLANHLELKAREIKLNLIPDMAKQSFQKFNLYPKLAVSEDKSWRLYPRHKKMYFLSLEGIDTVNLNLKHKYQKDSPPISCMKTLIVNVSSGREENTTKLKSIKKLESGTSAMISANEMSLSHILQKYPVEEKDKLLIHFSVKTLEIQMKAFPRIVMESYAMANAQDRRKYLSKCIHFGVKVPKQKNRILLFFEEKPLHQIDLDLPYKNIHFCLGLPVESMSPKPNTLPKHILKLNTVAVCKEVDNSEESDSLSIDKELLEKHTSFKNQSPHENSSLIRKFLEPTLVCASDTGQHGRVKKNTTALSVLKSHVTPEKDKQCHIWFQETNTHESFDLKTRENVPSLVDSHSIQISEDFTDSQTFIESSADLEASSALEVHESEECMFLEATPYLSQESQNVLFELQKGIPLENIYKMKKLKTDLKPFYSEDSGSHHSRSCRKHSSVVTPPSYESSRSRKHRSSSKMRSPNWLCHSSLNTIEAPFVSSSNGEEKLSWITRNRKNYSSAPLTESNIKLHLRKSQDKPHRHPDSKKRKKAKFDLFTKNVHWDRDYSYTPSKEKCTRKKNMCSYESERADYFPSKRKSASQPHRDALNFHSERKQNQPFFYVCIPADSLEIIPKTIRWTIPQKTLKKRNFRVPLVAKISSSCNMWSSSRKMLGSLLEAFNPVHQN
ncbi:coiled-coil domain containing 168 [Rhinolophus ferrumequinum]|uniref:Coiled-coil domain containing 168 n=1 Tax=Rhinolophus ferrumequinum TaxID=59479 RepID=A0A7J7ZPJ2_RHIFE|nr:coiled-coil domain containing 168 [Rhinolophus ferrumequinum]